MVRGISALMPVRNGEIFLPSSISSIEMNQKWLNEILIVDDGSTDKTAWILKEWAEKNSKVRILRTDGLGLVKSLNLGLSESNYEFVARFDVDDKYSADRIEQQSQYLTPSTAAVFSDYSLWSQRNGFLGEIPSAIFPHATSISLISAQRSAHPSVIYSREAVLDAGGYRESDFPAEDYSLWLRLAKTKALISVPKVLLNYCLSSGSVSFSHRESMKKKTLELRLDIGIDRNDYLISLDKLPLTLKEYEDYESAKVRKLLHLSDLFKVSLQTQNSERDRRLILSHLYKELRSKNGYVDSLQFGLRSLHRKFIRLTMRSL
jgi:glycosyltransferase involved in cell wall biosynthesis